MENTAYVFQLSPVPMADHGRYCENPYWHDGFRSGTQLTEHGRFHIMHGNMPAIEGAPYLTQVRNSDIVIVDQKTGRRLRIDLNVFEDESFWDQV